MDDMGFCINCHDPFGTWDDQEDYYGNRWIVCETCGHEEGVK